MLSVAISAALNPCYAENVTTEWNGDTRVLRYLMTTASASEDAEDNGSVSITILKSSGSIGEGTRRFVFTTPPGKPPTTDDDLGIYPKLKMTWPADYGSRRILFSVVPGKKKPVMPTKQEILGKGMVRVSSPKPEDRQERQFLFKTSAHNTSDVNVYYRWGGYYNPMFLQDATGNQIGGEFIKAAWGWTSSAADDTLADASDALPDEKPPGPRGFTTSAEPATTYPIALPEGPEIPVTTFPVLPSELPTALPTTDRGGSPTPSPAVPSAPAITETPATPPALSQKSAVAVKADGADPVQSGAKVENKPTGSVEPAADSRAAATMAPPATAGGATMQGAPGKTTPSPAVETETKPSLSANGAVPAQPAEPQSTGQLAQRATEPQRFIEVPKDRIWNLPPNVSIKETLSNWAARVGWVVTWDVDTDYEALVATNFVGDFQQAVAQLFNALPDSAPIRAEFRVSNIPQLLLVTQNKRPLQ